MILRLLARGRTGRRTAIPARTVETPRRSSVNLFKGHTTSDRSGSAIRFPARDLSTCAPWDEVGLYRVRWGATGDANREGRVLRRQDGSERHGDRSRFGVIVSWGRVVLVTADGREAAALTFALRESNPGWDVALIDYVPGVQVETDCDGFGFDGEDVSHGLAIVPDGRGSHRLTTVADSVGSEVEFRCLRCGGWLCANCSPGVVDLGAPIEALHGRCSGGAAWVDMHSARVRAFEVLYRERGGWRPPRWRAKGES